MATAAHTPFQPTTQGVSVIVPAFNEEHGVGPVLDQLHAVLSVSERVYEIVVIDDGSSDATAEAVRSRPATEPVILLQHHANRGYGASLKTGIRHARYDTLCITDADGTYPNERIPDLLDQMGEARADMVVGARTGEFVQISLVRRPAKWVIGKLASLVAGDSIPDLNSGLRVFRRGAAMEFFDLLPDGFSFTTTITLGMLTNGYLVEYVPIDYHARVGSSKIRPIRDTLNFVQLILRIALYFAPLKLFLPLSLLLALLGLAWGLFSYFALSKLADVSTLIILMTAVQVAVIGLLAELINRRSPSYCARRARHRCAPRSSSRRSDVLRPAGPKWRRPAMTRSEDVWLRLKAGVVDSGLCTHCGTCAGLSQGALRMQTTLRGPLPVPAGPGPVMLPPVAYDACPGKGVDYPALNRRVFGTVFGSAPDNWLIGHTRRIGVGYADRAAHPPPRRIRRRHHAHLDLSAGIRSDRWGRGGASRFAAPLASGTDHRLHTG